MAVVATLSKGYDLDYIWTQVDRGPAKDAASYYIQASETGGELNIVFTAAREMRPWRTLPAVQEVSDRLLTLMAG